MSWVEKITYRILIDRLTVSNTYSGLLLGHFKKVLVDEWRRELAQEIVEGGINTWSSQRISIGVSSFFVEVSQAILSQAIHQLLDWWLIALF